MGDLGIIQARECNTAMELSLSILNYEPGTLGLRFCMQSICMPLIFFFLTVLLVVLLLHGKALLKVLTCLRRVIAGEMVMGSMSISLWFDSWCVGRPLCYGIERVPSQPHLG